MPPTPTLIVGAGPAGAAAAIILARAGHPVTLLEREASPRHVVCGEFLSAEALQLLAGLGIQPQAHRAPSINTVRLASSHLLTQAALPFPAQSLTRRCLDTLLQAAAQAAGATLLRGEAVQSLSPAPNNTWQAALASGQTLTAAHVLLATGKHDLRGFPRAPGPQPDLVALKLYLQLSPAQTADLAGAVELLLFPHGYAGLQLVEDGAANLAALVHRAHLPRPLTPANLLAILTRANPHAAARLANAFPLLPKPLALSHIPYGFNRRHALGSTLYAVGDQAAVIPSFTGDGISIALHTGIAAAQALLAGEPATLFQARLHRQLRPQLNRATLLARALLHPVSKPVLATAAHAFPALLRAAASLTRLPACALQTTRV